MVSHNYFNRKLDEFGHDHDKAIKQKIENKVNAIKQKYTLITPLLKAINSLLSIPFQLSTPEINLLGSFLKFSSVFLQGV